MGMVTELFVTSNWSWHHGKFAIALYFLEYPKNGLRAVKKAARRGRYYFIPISQVVTAEQNYLIKKKKECFLSPKSLPIYLPLSHSPQTN